MTTPNNIPPGYRAFDLSDALKGAKTVTRAGRKVRRVIHDPENKLETNRVILIFEDGSVYGLAKEGGGALHAGDLFHPIESAAVQWPAPIAFKDRMPTAEDGNTSGYIQAFDPRNKTWWTIDCSDDDSGYTHWLPQPPAPVSAEDAAFEEFYRSDACPTIEDTAARKVWNAALVFARKEGK